MTPVRVQGTAAEVLAEAMRNLRRGPLLTLTPAVLGFVLLAFAADRWFLALSELGLPSMAIATTVWLLIAGAAAIMHLNQLMLAPGVSVPSPPDTAARWRRLARVWSVEAAAAVAPALVIGIVDALAHGTLARSAAHALLWRNEIGGLPVPGVEWVIAWVGYVLLHLPGTTWLWPAMAANYPAGTLRATATLAARAGRRTAWLLHATAGTAVAVTCLAVWRGELGMLALLPLVGWPAITNTAAARVRPDA